MTEAADNLLGGAATRFRALDSWRGVAAVLVVFYHCVFVGLLNDNSFVRAGYLFVDFFFVLSGFVIAFAYADRVTTPISAGGFLLRRFGRLWPLHATMLIAFAGAEGLNHILYAHSGLSEAFKPSVNDNTLLTFLANAAMLNALGLSSTITWNGASWSIGAEYCAYLAFAFAALYFRAALLPLAAALAALGAASIWLGSHHQPLMDATYDLGFLRCLYGFFAGVLVYGAFAANRLAGLTGRAATLAEIGAVAAAAAFMTFAGASPAAIAAPLVFAAVVFIFAHEAGAVSRLLLARPFAMLGAWSYSIYMTQGLIGNAYDRAIRLVDRASGLSALHHLDVAGRDFWAASGIGGAFVLDVVNLILVAAIVLCASLTFAWIEEPARKFANRVAARFEAQGDAAIAAVASQIERQAKRRAS